MGQYHVLYWRLDAACRLKHALAFRVSPFPDPYEFCQKPVDRFQRNSNLLPLAKSAIQQKRFGSRISSTLLATRSSKPGDATNTSNAIRPYRMLT
jgi:hypothetical protein